MTIAADPQINAPFFGQVSFASPGIGVEVAWLSPSASPVFFHKSIDIPC